MQPRSFSLVDNGETDKWDPIVLRVATVLVGAVRAGKGLILPGGNVGNLQGVALTLFQSPAHHFELKNYLVGPAAFVFAVVRRLVFLNYSRLVIRFG